MRKLPRDRISGLENKMKSTGSKNTNKPCKNRIDKCFITYLQNIALCQLVTATLPYPHVTVRINSNSTHPSLMNNCFLIKSKMLKIMRVYIVIFSTSTEPNSRYLSKENKPFRGILQPRKVILCGCRRTFK